MRVAILVTVCLVSFPALGDNELRYESCLLGQDTATLFYELLKKEPDKADSLLRDVNNRIARRAFYWAMVYAENNKTHDELAERYMYVCMKTGPTSLPAPQV